jgi:hypothetical protein
MIQILLVVIRVDYPYHSSVIKETRIPWQPRDIPVWRSTESNMSLSIDLSEVLKDGEIQLLSRPLQGQKEPFDWQRLWDTKGVGLSGKVCQCHRTYLERAGDECTEEVQKFRHSIFSTWLEVEMRNMILSDRTSVKATTFNDCFEDWEYDTYACRGAWWIGGM